MQVQFELFYIIIRHEISNPIQYDVGGCVTCISNKVKYLAKERRYKKEVVLSF